MRINNGIALAELVSYMTNVRETSASPVFKLHDLVEIILKKLQQLSPDSDIYNHAIRLTERLLNHFPDLRAESDGKQVLFVFASDFGDILHKAINMTGAQRPCYLATAAHKVCKEMFEIINCFDGTFKASSQLNSIPVQLLELVRMILDGTYYCKQLNNCSQEALSIAQLLQYNVVQRCRGSMECHYLP